MKKFDAYTKVIYFYRDKTPIYPGLIKDNLTKNWVQDMNNPTPEEKGKAE